MSTTKSFKELFEEGRKQPEYVLASLDIAEAELRHTAKERGGLSAGIDLTQLLLASADAIKRGRTRITELQALYAGTGDIISNQAQSLEAANKRIETVEASFRDYQRAANARIAELEARNTFLINGQAIATSEWQREITFLKERILALETELSEARKDKERLSQSNDEALSLLQIELENLRAAIDESMKK